ncbi:MAG: OmpH family outer membrane protein [Pseudomonadota bacterium]
MKAQDAGPPAPILTLNQERLYSASEFGLRVRQELEEASAALAAENRRIEVALVAEENRLTEERATMDPVEFRALAEDFDERVTGIRRAQVEKRNAVQREADAERNRFFELAYPVLFQLVEETGALAILNQSAVILSSRQIDITEQAIARVNAEIGAAPPPPEAPRAPEPRPTPDESDADIPATSD